MTQRRPLYIWQKIYNALIESMPGGLSTDDIMNKFKLTKTSVYSQIHLINHHGDNSLRQIENIGGTYFISEKDKKKAITQEQKTYLQNGSTNNSYKKKKTKNQVIPEHLYDTISELSDTDKNDFKDLLKKSIFYGKSSIALLEANEQVNSLMQEVG